VSPLFFPFFTHHRLQSDDLFSCRLVTPTFRPRLSNILSKFSHIIYYFIGCHFLEGVTRGGPPPSDANAHKAVHNVIHRRPNLGGNTKIDLQPFRCRLVLGTPRHAVRLVDPGIARLAAVIPVARVRRRSGYLPIFHLTGYQSQRTVRLTTCTTCIGLLRYHHLSAVASLGWVTPGRQLTVSPLFIFF